MSEFDPVKPDGRTQMNDNERELLSRRIMDWFIYDQDADVSDVHWSDLDQFIKKVT